MHGLVEGLAGFVIRWLESLDGLGLVNLSPTASLLSYMLIAEWASKGHALGHEARSRILGKKLAR